MTGRFGGVLAASLPLQWQSAARRTELPPAIGDTAGHLAACGRRTGRLRWAERGERGEVLGGEQGYRSV